MALTVTFTIDTTDLRFQQDTICIFTVTNNGPEVVRFSNPRMTPTLPELKVVNVATGAETIHQRQRRGNQAPPIEDDMKPGQVYKSGLSLLDIPVELAPGSYDVSLGVHYDRGTRRAESPPVRIKVRATTPGRIALDRPTYLAFTGVWVDQDADPAEIVIMPFSPRWDGRVWGLHVVAKAPADAAPCISATRNGIASNHHWVAWREGARISFANFHRTLGASKPGAIPLPGDDVLIAAPLHIEPTPDDDSQPDGGLLLWAGKPAQGELQAYTLTAKGASAPISAPLPGPKPLALDSVVRSNGRRLALVAQTSGGSVSLNLVPWPGVAGQAKRLGEWPGEFLGLGHTLDHDDVLHGVLLLRAAGGADLQRLDFVIDAKDRLAVGRPTTIAIDPKDPMASAIVRVSDRGGVSTLLRAASGTWSIYDGKAVTALPDTRTATAYPLDCCFLNSDSPLVIVGRKGGGVHMLTPAGGPLPENPF